MEHEMRKEINKFKDFLNENSEEKLNISDVIGSENYIKKISDEYTKLETSDVTEELKYTPSEIRHLVKMVYIDGYKKGMSDFK